MGGFEIQIQGQIRCQMNTGTGGGINIVCFAVKLTDRCFVHLCTAPVLHQIGFQAHMIRCQCRPPGDRLGFHLPAQLHTFTVALTETVIGRGGEIIVSADIPDAGTDALIIDLPVRTVGGTELLHIAVRIPQPDHRVNLSRVTVEYRFRDRPGDIKAQIGPVEGGAVLKIITGIAKVTAHGFAL